MTTSILHHQSAQLTSVVQLIKETRLKEEEMLQEVALETDSSHTIRSKAIQRCEEFAESKRITAEQLHEKESAEVEKRRELEPKILTDRHEIRLSEITEDAEDLTHETESKFDEAQWLAESVYEAAISKPNERYGKIEEELDKELQKLDQLCIEAPRMLSRLRQSDDSSTEDHDDARKQHMSQYVLGAAGALTSIKRDPRARLFIGYKPYFIITVITAIIGVSAIYSLENKLLIIGAPILAFCLTLVGLFFVYATGQNSVRMKMQEFRTCVSAARRVREYELKKAERKRLAEEKDLKETRQRELANAEDNFGPRLKEIERLCKKDIGKEEKRFTAVKEKLSAKLEEDANNIQTTFNTAISTLEKEKTDTLHAIESEHSATLQAIEDKRSKIIAGLKINWDNTFHSFTSDLQKQREQAQKLYACWSDTDWNSWTPPTEPLDRIPLGNFTADLRTIGGAIPIDEQLQLPQPPLETLPLCMTLPRDSSLLVSTSGKLRDQSIEIIQNSVVRVLTAVPPGKAKFTLIDPVGLGETYAGILHLADYEESQLLDRAWTEVRHIEQQLTNLTQHMETVIQKYLRNEFDSIDDYNEQAGEIAEPYRFLVIADFPTNFTENSIRRLSSIITSGAKCGVHVLMHRDMGQPLPQGIDEDTLNRFAMKLMEEDGTLAINEKGMRTLPLTTTAPPDDVTTTTIVKAVGELAETTHRVEVPFGIIAPKENEYWTHSTSHKLSVPLGRAGATKLQNLVLGRGTAQHALIAGKTGSGKSTLLHVLITNLALWHSPDEVEFYLVDFKKGVEFKTYATHKLPHAKVVAVESDREFGISVLQKLDNELKRRGELFRDLGVQDIAGFRKSSDAPMPRILLIVDEFQEFFVDDDKIAQEASLLLDRIVRQGRAFGVHAILGSQTLDGAYTLGRSTMGQMAVRIALQCSEADSYIILSEDNAAARLLSRPGEAIYNDSAGKVEGNSPFQIVWLDEGIREKELAKINELYSGEPRDMIVYEGNTPIQLQDNAAFTKIKANAPSAIPLVSSAWLGAAMAIKEDTSATFRQATANNLLIIGQQEEVTTSLIATSMLSLDAQYPSDHLRMTVFDGTHGDATHASLIPEIVEHVLCNAHLVKSSEVEHTMQTMYDELKLRLEEGAQGKSTHFLVVNGLHRFRNLRRNEDDYGFSMSDEEKQKTPAQVFAELIKEGPALGMHVIVTTDTLTNLNRSVDRQGLREFDLRVLLQMGNNDSSNLIDSTAAAKLGLHRALLYSEEAGTIEPFRPYSMPVVRDL